jgi:hypothetical protein
MDMQLLNFAHHPKQFKPSTPRYLDILPKDTMPKDILPNGHLAYGRFAERPFCRTNSLPKGQLAENRDVISSKCLGL